MPLMNPAPGTNIIAILAAVITSIGVIAASSVSAFSARRGSGSGAKHKIDPINEMARYWQTYSAVFPDDAEVQERVMRAMGVLANRAERVARASDPEAAMTLLAASEPITTSKWRFPLLLYGPIGETLFFYAYRGGYCSSRILSRSSLSSSYQCGHTLDLGHQRRCDRLPGRAGHRRDE